MKVLVACEYSGIVRDAFIAKGHDAVSCDLLPTESPGPHYEGSVLDILYDGWDMMIGHPPCNYISYAGTSIWNLPGRSFKRLEALQFFATLWEAPIPKICLENPKSCASPVIAKYSQEIQPYYFGEEHLKTTWLWLKGLPKLEFNPYTEIPSLFEMKMGNPKPEALYEHPRKATGVMKKRYYADAVESNGNRAKTRAKFWPKVAAAMADQWG